MSAIAPKEFHMKKSFRSIVLMTAFVLAAATPMLKAEPMGTNPRPQGSIPSSTLSGIGHCVLAMLGI